MKRFIYFIMSLTIFITLYTPSKALANDSEYKIYCYLCTNDKQPINTLKYSINESYVMQLYSYTSSSDDINLPDPTESLSIYNTFNNYEFLGWSVSGSKEYKKHVTIPKGSTGNKYYIARWQGKLINIYFDSNNGSALEPKQSRYNSLLGTLPTPIKESYTFLGWYTQPSGGEQITHSTYTPAMDTTYYAHWEPIKYTITCYKYDENDTIQIENILTYTIESNDMELSIPTREGYIFNGWIGSDLNTASKTVIIKKGSTGNKIYTGTWTKDPCADGHKYINKINKATTYSNGQILPTCHYCGAKKTPTIIYYPKTISVSCTSYTYDGTNKYPKIVIKTSTGSTLKEKSDYTINYVNNKNVGSGTIKINFIGNYTGTLTKEFNILPKNTTINKLHSESKKFNIKWNKQQTQTTGYQLEYTWPAAVATSKLITINNNNTTSRTISGLKNGTTYYVRIRTYKTIGNKNYYSTWSSQKSIKVDSPRLNFKSSSLYRGQTKQLKLNYIPTNAKVKWKSSNKKIATVSSSGKVKAKALGKTTIKATYKGKTYKATITVTHMTPDFAAILYSYNTRSNYFTLKIKNNSKKSIIIQKGTTKVIDCDYKSFDRKVTLSKSQTIKPGQTKTIKFKVKGSTTWRHVNDFTLYYYFKLDGKKYYAKADVLNTSKYKKGSSWKNTYAKKTWYEDFVCEIY